MHQKFCNNSSPRNYCTPSSHASQAKRNELLHEIRYEAQKNSITPSVRAKIRKRRTIACNKWPANYCTTKTPCNQWATNYCMHCLTVRTLVNARKPLSGYPFHKHRAPIKCCTPGRTTRLMPPAPPLGAGRDDTSGVEVTGPPRWRFHI